MCEFVTKCVWVYMGEEEQVCELVLSFNLALMIVCAFYMFTFLNLLFFFAHFSVYADMLKTLWQS